jgi:2-dehydropantoate 2-reductase
MPDSIGVVGGGALGTLLATRFLEAQADVRIVTRSAGSRHDELKKKHASLQTGGDFGLLADCDLVFVCVKSYHTKDVARSLGSAKLKHASICSLQNGWGHMELLEAGLPGLPILAAATSLGAYLDGHGLLHATDRGTTVVAPWRPAELDAAGRAAESLRSTGLLAEVRPDARSVLWRKLALNSAINPVTALAHCQNGALLHEVSLFEIARGAALEAARVGAKLGVLDREFDPEESLRAILKETAANSSSMKEDLERGRRTEIEEITGAIVRLAGSLGEPVPIQTALLTLIRAAEHRLQQK